MLFNHVVNLAYAREVCRSLQLVTSETTMNIDKSAQYSQVLSTLYNGRLNSVQKVINFVLDNLRNWFNNSMELVFERLPCQIRLALLRHYGALPKQPF